MCVCIISTITYLRFYNKPNDKNNEKRMSASRRHSFEKIFEIIKQKTIYTLAKICEIAHKGCIFSYAVFETFVNEHADEKYHFFFTKEKTYARSVCENSIEWVNAHTG